MQSIEGRKPICYQLADSHKVNALPYIDKEHPEYKTKVLYLIKTQQNQMAFEPQKYLQQLKMSDTPFIDSAQFNQLAQSILKNLQNKQKKQKKQGELKGNVMGAKNAEQIKKEIVKYQNNIVKDLNLQIYQKLGPILMKKAMQALEHTKGHLVQEIERQKAEVQQINKLRKYEQLQAQDKEQTVFDRTRVMIHKKRKVQ